MNIFENPNTFYDALNIFDYFKLTIFSKHTFECLKNNG